MDMTTKRSPRSNQSWLMMIGLGFALTMGIATATSHHAAAGDKKGAGMKCDFDRECESGNCRGSTCRAQDGSEKKAAGMKCDFDRECESGNCRGSTCRTQDGSDKKGAGLKCDFDRECESGSCRGSKCESR